MQIINSALQSHIDSGITTLCSLWLLQLNDGTKIGLTDHDRPLQFEGVSYGPQHSFDASDSEAHLGFAADSGALRLAFNLPQLTQDTLQAGMLDEARLTHYRVNWEDVSQFVLMSVGRVGQVQASSEGFEAEWTGLATQLERSTGRIFSRQCDAELGDSRIGLNLADFPEGTICPRSFEACANHFSNTVNFRGFPYLLGDDALQASPQIGELRDGSSRYQ